MGTGLTLTFRRKLAVEADYVGFTIPDQFVVSYGLDYADRYRNLPAVCVLADAQSVKMQGAASGFR